MKLYVIVETNHTTGAISVPSCSDSCDAALEEVKKLALSRWSQRTNQGGDFNWLSTMLDDLVDNKRNCCIKISFGDSDFGFRYTGNAIQFLEGRTPAVTWTIGETENVQLGKASMAAVADDYDYELVHTSVLYSLRDRYPDLDETPQSVQELIDDLTSRARKDISKGCDEDWSIDEAFRAMAEDVRRICEAEY